jgi:hypothetical protein
MIVPCAFGSPSSTKRQRACVEHHFWHLGMAGQSDYVARMVHTRDQVNSGESIYPMYGYPNLSVEICWILPMNRSRPSPL